MYGNGQVKIYSRKGRGTVVQMRIPQGPDSSGGACKKGLTQKEEVQDVPGINCR